MVLTANPYNTAIQGRAEKVSRKFSVAFTLFSKCHNIYDKCQITQNEIDSLGKSFTLGIQTQYCYLVHIVGPHITSFLCYYKEQFPYATVTPKLHILEQHIVPWLDKWKVGLGLMGEQGAESIHAHFNSLKRTYQAIPNGVDRLQYIMKEHFLHTAPANVTARPPPAKRPKKATQ